MDESNKKKGSPSAVAIQIIGSHDKGNYAVVYDLKDGKVWKRLELDDDIKSKENWTNIFKFLTKECPPEIVKSIFLNVFGVVSSGDVFANWLLSILAMGETFGYKTLHGHPGFVTIFTTELLLAKQKGRKHQIGDYVLFVETSLDYCQLHLLKKQEIGWDVLDGKVITGVNAFPRHLKDFLSKNSITAKQLKDAFVKINSGAHDQKVLACLKQIVGVDHLFHGKYASFLDRISHNTLGETSADYLEISGEYMAKVYAGEEYFNDYDCYIGNTCIGKFELQVGSSTIVLPVQFKRVPYTIKQKINFIDGNGVTLFASCDHLLEHFIAKGNNFGKVISFTDQIKINSKTAVVTLHLNGLKSCLFKMEKDDADKTLITSNVPSDEWNIDRPRLYFGKDDCSVEYSKEGLLWKLKDANGNTKIPFKISFDKEIYIGDAAEKYGKDYLLNFDVHTLRDEKLLKEMAKENKNVIVDDKSGEIKILVKTINGIRKTTSKDILNVFMKSINKLISSKVDKPVAVLMDVEFSTPRNLFFAD